MFKVNILSVLSLIYSRLHRQDRLGYIPIDFSNGSTILLTFTSLPFIPQNKNGRKEK
jgi:hypothetical protein